MTRDAIGAHGRDELGITEAHSARPVQAALASAASFAVGAALPLAVTALAPAQSLIPWISGRHSSSWPCWVPSPRVLGGAGVLMGAWRVPLWGALAMAVTAGVGALFGAAV